MKALLRTLACTVCLLLSNAALGEIRLHFTGDLRPIEGPENYTFDVPLADFPSTDTPLYLSEPECTVCWAALLVPDARASGYSPFNNAMIRIERWENGGALMLGYYFPPGALGSFGTYESVSGPSLLPAFLTVSPIPEPAAAHMLGAGAIALAALRWRGRSAKRKTR
ncbi:hypothetical protein [Massilia sp. METH4]|uniref:hypothetical protein n=1 Tax=Massilia sp. METH4 TaxID=3123041 RepID=UPI0030D0012F